MDRLSLLLLVLSPGPSAESRALVKKRSTSATPGRVPAGQADVAAAVADGHVAAVGAGRGVAHVL